MADAHDPQTATLGYVHVKQVLVVGSFRVVRAVASDGFNRSRARRRVGDHIISAKAHRRGSERPKRSGKRAEEKIRDGEPAEAG